MKTWFSLAVYLSVLVGATGCETLGAIDEGLYKAVPLHPVTGEPMANLVSEEQEIGKAREAWMTLAREAAAKGVPVDPQGPRLDQIRSVFRRLVAVAHRQHLPWEIHLFDHETVNAMTVGGGMVFVFSGIFTDYPRHRGFLRPDDDEIAAVLAHEIAHVTLMHLPERETSGWFTHRDEKDRYYGAAYTTRDEAEADKLSMLYIALAGFDPNAAVTIWNRAHRIYGSDPRRTFYLDDHPMNADRMRANAELVRVVAPYSVGHGARNPDWRTILDDNPLFPRARAPAYSPGTGTAQAAAVVLRSMAQHEKTKAEAARRKTLARQEVGRQQSLVQLLQVTSRTDAQGQPAIYMQFRNASSLQVSYLSRDMNLSALRGHVLFRTSLVELARFPSARGVGP